MKAFTKDDIIRCMQKALAKLKDSPSFPYYNLMEATFNLLVEEEPSLKPSGSYLPDLVNNHAGRGPLSVPLMEGYWYLISNGYIVTGANNAHPPNFTQIRLTDLGREWALHNETPPEDQHGFLAALKAQVSNLNPVIEQYTVEAAAAFARQMYFAAAVMIGAASEKLLYLLLEALAGAVADPNEKKAITKIIDARGMRAMFAKLHQHLSQAKATKVLPRSISEGADTHLLSLQESIRVQRNDAVHPLAGKVTPQTVRLSLSSFPGACKKAYDLIGWLQTNKL